MSKYLPLWTEIKRLFEENTKEELILSFDDIEKILSFPIDHAFLSFKKELLAYGYCVKKISLKEKVITFQKINQ